MLLIMIVITSVSFYLSSSLSLFLSGQQAWSVAGSRHVQVVVEISLPCDFWYTLGVCLQWETIILLPYAIPRFSPPLSLSPLSLSFSLSLTLSVLVCLIK